jgi:hypothetical protein
MEFPKINVSSKADIQYITEIWRNTLSGILEQQYNRDDDPRLMEHVKRLLDQVMEECHCWVPGVVWQPTVYRPMTNRFLVVLQVAREYDQDGEYQH